MTNIEIPMDYYEEEGVGTEESTRRYIGRNKNENHQEPLVKRGYVFMGNMWRTEAPDVLINSRSHGIKIIAHPTALDVYGNPQHNLKAIFVKEDDIEKYNNFQ